MYTIQEIVKQLHYEGQFSIRARNFAQFNDITWLIDTPANDETAYKKYVEKRILSQCRFTCRSTEIEIVALTNQIKIVQKSVHECNKP